MPDAIFADPRLVPVYDPTEGERPDLDAYVALLDRIGARRIVDLGCGTGTLARMLAGRGPAAGEIVGVDPAEASIAYARGRPGAAGVRWIVGDATAIPPAIEADAVVMTGNVAQAIDDPAAWRRTLEAAHDALRPGGRLVVETRVPARRAWESWSPEATRVEVEVPGVGLIRRWTEDVVVEEADGTSTGGDVDDTGATDGIRSFLVGFTTITELPDGARIPSRSTLRFRERDEILADLAAAGLDVVEVLDAPDRPGLEWVFVARRPGTSDAER